MYEIDFQGFANILLLECLRILEKQLQIDF